MFTVFGAKFWGNDLFMLTWLYYISCWQINYIFLQIFSLFFHYLSIYLWCWLEKGRWPITQVSVTSSNMTKLLLYTVIWVKSHQDKIVIFCSCCSATVVELSESTLKFLIVGSNPWWYVGRNCICKHLFSVWFVCISSDDGISKFSLA